MSNYYGYDYSAPNDYLAHYGVPGMRWGHRKNPDRGSGNGQGAPRKRHLGLKIAGGVAAGAAAAGLGYLGYKNRKGLGNAARSFKNAMSTSRDLRKSLSRKEYSNREWAKDTASSIGWNAKKYGSKALRKMGGYANTGKSAAKGAYNRARNSASSGLSSARRFAVNRATRLGMQARGAAGRAGELRDAARLGADAVRTAAKNRLKRKRR